MCDLNAATLDEIADLPGISPTLACQTRLWAPYASWEDLESYLDEGHGGVRALKAVGAVIGPSEAPLRETETVREVRAYLSLADSWEPV